MTPDPKEGIKSIVKAGKKVKKVTSVNHVILNGTKAGLTVIDSINSKPTKKLVKNLETMETTLESKTENFQQFLDSLQVKFDKVIGEKAEQKLIAIEKWIDTHGGSQVETFFADNAAILNTRVGKLLFKRMKHNINRKKHKNDVRYNQ